MVLFAMNFLLRVFMHVSAEFITTSMLKLLYGQKPRCKSKVTNDTISTSYLMRCVSYFLWKVLSSYPKQIS